MFEAEPEARAFRHLLAATRWEKKMRDGKVLRAYTGKRFDYDGFCRDIDAADVLTHKEKSQVKKLFNPASDMHVFEERLKPVASWCKDLWNISSGNGPEDFDHSLPADSSLTKLWQEAYAKALKEYAPYLAKYKAVAPKTNGRDSSSEGGIQPYPYHTPSIKVSRSERRDIYIDYGNPPVLKLTSGFLEEFEGKTDSQKRGLLMHEASHVLEPVKANMSPDNYIILNHYLRFLTLSAVMRRNENNADALAAKLEDGHAFADDLGNTRESRRPLHDALNERIDAGIAKIKTVGKIAYAHGLKASFLHYYAMDRSASKTAEDRTIEETLLREVAGRGAIKAGDAVIGVTVNSLLKSDTLFATVGKIVDKYLSTHPATDERQRRLRTIEWKKRLEHKPHNPLGLTK